ncbi:class I SAM-dependent methyltransferase [Kribbella sp. NPDC051587]|uniref:class I SAM-dependent methyltransferase n=1 Tax=Kribbella sp. NPDC051587 TaxID=3364119 RepID=UPI00378D877A
MEPLLSRREAQYIAAIQGFAYMRGWCLADDSDLEALQAQGRELNHRIEQGDFVETDYVEKSAQDGYDRWASSYDSDNATNVLVRLEQEALDRVLSAGEGKKALDAACGTGRQASRLTKLGYEITGVDATSAMLDVARQNSPESRFLKGDLRDLPVQDGEFDLVISTLAVSHVRELDLVMSEFARAAKAGGRVVIVDVHPVQIMLGSHVTVREKDRMGAVRNFLHWPALYLASARQAGLEVDHFSEPLFESSDVDQLPAATLMPDANRAAFTGTPGLQVWAFRKLGAAGQR